MASFIEFIAVFLFGIISSVVLLFAMSRVFQNIRNPSHRCSLVVGASLLVMFVTFACLFPHVLSVSNGDNTKIGSDLVDSTPLLSAALDERAVIIEKLREELRSSLINYPILETELEAAVGAFEMGINYKQGSRKSVNCVRRPQIADILISNKHWQVLRTSPEKNDPTSYFIYNAYLDTRGARSRVRILMVADRALKMENAKENNYKPKFCQFWYSNNESRVEVERVVSMLSPWVWAVGGGQYRPYLVTCYLPKPTFGKKYARENKLRPLKPQDVPTSVSLVMNKCNLATNNVEIVYNVPKEKKDFGVCFKMLDFPVTHVSSRIVEMVELLKVLGVGGVHFPYLEDAVDKETMKVLKYYESSGFATLKAHSLPDHQTNLPLLRHLYLKNNLAEKRGQELIPYNDCFLANIYRYKIIGILDIDEVLLPTREANYQDFLQKIWEEKFSSYCFYMKLFVNTIKYSRNQSAELVTNENKPVNSEITTHVFFDRSPLFKGQRKRSIKCFHRSDSVLLIHNHYPLHCLEDKHCQYKAIPMDQAYLHHHRGISYSSGIRSLGDPLELIQNPFEYDPRIKSYRDEIMERKELILNNVGKYQVEAQPVN